MLSLFFGAWCKWSIWSGNVSVCVCARVFRLCSEPYHIVGATTTRSPVTVKETWHGALFNHFAQSH